MMSSVTIHVALCANERYFPGLYCAIGSSLKTLGPGYRLHIHVIDAGLAEGSKRQLENLVTSAKDHTIQWLPAPSSMFEGIQNRYYHPSVFYRLALPEILDVERVIYLDADLLVFECLGELWEKEIMQEKPLLAIQDRETRSLADDCGELAEALGVKEAGRYFNSGVLVLRLDFLRRENFTARVCTMLKEHGALARFADQTALNWYFGSRWRQLPARWNSPAWDFDGQDDNRLPAIFHYTNNAPWLNRLYSPSQALFERVAKELCFDLPKADRGLGHSAWLALTHWVLAPVRMGYQLTRLVRLKQGDDEQASSASSTLAHYWWRYFIGGPGRICRYQRRIREIHSDSFSPFPKSSS